MSEEFLEGTVRHRPARRRYPLEILLQSGPATEPGGTHGILVHAFDIARGVGRGARRHRRAHRRLLRFRLQDSSTPTSSSSFRSTYARLDPEESQEHGLG